MGMGKILTQLRTEKCIYQKELAAALQVSVGTISNYEQGRHYPDPNMLCKLAEFFGVTTDYLLGRTTFRYNPELLHRPLTDTYTVSDLVNTSLNLSPQHKSALAEYAELLKMSETTQLSGR